MPSRTHAQTKMSRAKLNELEGKCTGVLEEGENIKLKVISLHELWSPSLPPPTSATDTGSYFPSPPACFFPSSSPRSMVGA